MVRGVGDPTLADPARVVAEGGAGLSERACEGGADLRVGSIGGEQAAALHSRCVFCRISTPQERFVKPSSVP